MPDLNVVALSIDGAASSAEPQGLPLSPGALAVRAFAAGLPVPGRRVLGAWAPEVPAGDVRAFDAALAGLEAADDPSAVVPAAAPASNTIGSMAEMTTTLGVYQAVNEPAARHHGAASQASTAATNPLPSAFRASEAPAAPGAPAVSAPAWVTVPKQAAPGLQYTAAAEPAVVPTSASASVPTPVVPVAQPSLPKVDVPATLVVTQVREDASAKAPIGAPIQLPVAVTEVPAAVTVVRPAETLAAAPSGTQASVLAAVPTRAVPVAQPSLPKVDVPAMLVVTQVREDASAKAQIGAPIQLPAAVTEVPAAVAVVRPTETPAVAPSGAQASVLAAVPTPAVPVAQPSLPKVDVPAMVVVTQVREDASAKAPIGAPIQLPAAVTEVPAAVTVVRPTETPAVAPAEVQASVLVAVPTPAVPVAQPSLPKVDVPAMPVVAQAREDASAKAPIEATIEAPAAVKAVGPAETPATAPAGAQASVLASVSSPSVPVAQPMLTKVDVPPMSVVAQARPAVVTVVGLAEEPATAPAGMQASVLVAVPAPVVPAAQPSLPKVDAPSAPVVAQAPEDAGAKAPGEVLASVQAAVTVVRPTETPAVAPAQVQASVLAAVPTPAAPVAQTSLPKVDVPAMPVVAQAREDASAKAPSGAPIELPAAVTEVPAAVTVVRPAETLAAAPSGVQASVLVAVPTPAAPVAQPSLPKVDVPATPVVAQAREDASAKAPIGATIEAPAAVKAVGPTETLAAATAGVQAPVLASAPTPAAPVAQPSLPKADTRAAGAAPASDVPAPVLAQSPAGASVPLVLPTSKPHPAVAHRTEASGVSAVEDSPSPPDAAESMTQPVTFAAVPAPVPAPAPMVPASAVVEAREGPSTSGLEVAKIVQAVTRTLAWRDLEALDAGREVVLRLDEALLPQTVLTFRPSTVTEPADIAGAAPQTQVLVSVETRSQEVREFLDSNGQALIEAMSREAPSVRWVRGVVNSWLDKPGVLSADPSSALSAVASADPAQPLVASAAASTSQGGASLDRDAQSAPQPDSDESGGSDGSASQGRGSSSGSSSEQGQGQGDSRSTLAASGLEERARADAVQRWSNLSETARQRASQAFAEAVDGRA